MGGLSWACFLDIECSGDGVMDSKDGQLLLLLLLLLHASCC